MAQSATTADAGMELEYTPTLADLDVIDELGKMDFSEKVWFSDKTGTILLRVEKDDLLPVHLYQSLVDYGYDITLRHTFDFSHNSWVTYTLDSQ